VIDVFFIASLLWLLLGLVLALLLGRVIRDGHRRIEPVEPPTVVIHHWVDLLPVDALTDDEVADRFDDIVALKLRELR
jgi:hypothetical protein